MDPQTSTDFLRKLKIMAKYPERLVQCMFRQTFQYQDIPISKSQNTEHTLLLSPRPMSHGDKEPNTQGFFLQFLPHETTLTADTPSLTDASNWKTWFQLLLHKITRTAETTSLPCVRNWKTLSIPNSGPSSTSTPDNAIEAMFLPLGWLVDNGTKPGHEFQRITNYVVMLNISTDPISLWLVYDYYPTVDIEDMRIVQLCDSENFNPEYHSEDPKPSRGYNALNRMKKAEMKVSDRVVRRRVLQASGLEAFNQARQAVGTTVDFGELPFVARWDILDDYQETLFSDDKNELFSTKGAQYIHHHARSLLDRQDLNVVLDKDEQRMLQLYLEVDSSAAFLQRLQEEKTTRTQSGEEQSPTQAGDRAVRNRDDTYSDSNAIASSLRTTSALGHNPIANNADDTHPTQPNEHPYTPTTTGEPNFFNASTNSTSRC